MNLNKIILRVNETDELIIGSGLINECSGYLKKYWPEYSVLIVADTNTWRVAGKALSQHLIDSGAGIAEPLIFSVPPFLHADYKNVELIKKKAEQLKKPVLVSVGSGTINDLVKRAAHEISQSYLCVGTAASMDGYCSSGAALSKNGRKQTMECSAPRVIIADTDILSKAPAEASAAGFGDLASKLTAGADWLIADCSGDDPIVKDVWAIVQPRLEHWLAAPEKIAAGDAEALSGVFEGLNYSGLAMQVLGRSRAASGSEHLLSHIWEMSGHIGVDGNPISHGFQVSIGILCVCALMDEVFKMNADDIDIEEATRAYPDWEHRAVEIEQQMNKLPTWEEYLDICREKHLSTDELKQKLNGLKANWEDLKKKVKKRLPSYPEMYKLLKTAGCPVKPEDINLKRDDAIAAYRKAQCMRNRYTVLDLAYELGILSDCIENIAKNDFYLN